MKDALGFGCFLSVLSLAILVPVLVLAGLLANASCNNVAELTGHATRWEVLAGCFIDIDGRWVPYERWVHNDGN